MKRFLAVIALLVSASLHAAVRDVASATTITLHGTGVYRITGTNTIQNILGVRDGDELIFLPAGAFGLSGAGNISPITTTAGVGIPILFTVANGMVYELGPVPGGGGGGGGAPTTATYITQTANATLSAEQALAALTTGMLYSTTGTGVVSIAVEGTDYYKPGGTDVAIGDGGTGASSKLVAFNNLSPLLVKGDVLTHNGTNNVRIPVGADGTLLTADSTQPEGVRFAPATLGTEYNEDTADADAEKLTMAGVRRADTAATTTDTNGDRTVLEVDGNGRLWVNGSSVTQPMSAASLPLPTGAAQEHTTAASPSSVRVSADGAAFLTWPTATANRWWTTLTNGAIDVAVRGASSAAAATDPSLVVALSPNSPIPTGSNVIGALTANQSVNVTQIAGSAIATAAAGVAEIGVVGNAGAAFDAANNAAMPANAIAAGVQTATIDTSPTAATAGNIRYQLASTEGVTYVQEGGPKRFSCFVQAVTVTTQCQAAPTAGLRAYVTGAIFSNQAATVQTLDIVYGTGTNCATGITAISHKIQFGTVATTTSPFVATMYLTTPLIPASANAICVRPSAATAFGATLTGFIAP